MTSYLTHQSHLVSNAKYNIKSGGGSSSQLGTAPPSHSTNQRGNHSMDF